MTISEIEATLHTLEQRHKDLTEDMLLTLLSGSGWEERAIQEALVIFKTTRALPEGHDAPSPSPKAKSILTPPLPDAGKGMVYYNGSGEEEKKVPVFADTSKDIPLAKDKPDSSYRQAKPSLQAQAEPLSSEPQSIVPPSQPLPQTQRVEPPPNLPLKPFESSDHVWPLSKYKDVFHGDLPPVLSRTEAKLVEEHKDEHKEEPSHKSIKIKRTGFDGEDEGLIVLTGISLFIVLCLLAYMYSNGRL